MVSFFHRFSNCLLYGWFQDDDDDGTIVNVIWTRLNKPKPIFHANTPRFYFGSTLSFSTHFRFAAVEFANTMIFRFFFYFKLFQADILSPSFPINCIHYLWMKINTIFNLIWIVTLTVHENVQWNQNKRCWHMRNINRHTEAR